MSKPSDLAQGTLDLSILELGPLHGRTSWLEHLARDLRYAMRTLRRAPAFTSVSILTLALAIGATTAIFTVVDAVLLRPLGYRESERLVNLGHTGETVAPATFLDWKASSHAFEGMAIAEYWTPNLAGVERPEEIVALHADTELLPLFGVAPMLGRAFLADEGHEGTQRVAIIGWDFWQRRFAGDAHAIGRTLRLDGQPYTIVGVMPRGYRFVPFWAEDAQLVAPFVLDQRRDDRDGSSLRVFGRLRPGVSLAQARAELGGIARAIEARFPSSDQTVTLWPLLEKTVGAVRPALLALLAAASAVLLIACANVAHLQLMRAASREREIAVRSALGGSRARLLQQSFVESAVVSFVGGMLGLALAWAGVRALIVLAPPNVPRLDEIAIDPRVLLFALLITALAAIGFGLAPALAASRGGANESLRDGARSIGSGGRTATRSTLVVSEFAMALVLLVAAGLVTRSFISMLNVDAGYDPRRVLSMQVSVRGTRAERVDRRAPFFAELERRVRALNGVEAASATNHLPLHGDHWHFPFFIEGAAPLLKGERQSATFRIARPEYFATMRVPVLAGRDFTRDDERQRAKVVVVNEAMARRRWPGASPIGRRLSVSDPAKHADWYTVVGVAKEVRQDTWTEESSEEMYFPHIDLGADTASATSLEQMLDPSRLTLVIRTTSDPAQITTAVRDLVRTMEPDAPVSDVITMQHAVDDQFAAPRFYLLLFGVFAGVTLVLAVVGVYGVISYGVARRTREIGLRLALGATRRSAFGMVVRQGMRLSLVGTAVGLLVAMALTRYLASLLYRVPAIDAMTFTIVAVLLSLVALAACGIPARRATRIDPMVALRAD